MNILESIRAPRDRVVDRDSFLRMCPRELEILDLSHGARRVDSIPRPDVAQLQQRTPITLELDKCVPHVVGEDIFYGVAGSVKANLGHAKHVAFADTGSFEASGVTIEAVICTVDMIPILSRLDGLVDELLSEISLAYVLALPISHESVVLEHSPRALRGEVVVAESVSTFSLDERFVATKLLRDLGEILSCGRAHHELTDHFLKAGLIVYRTLIAFNHSRDQQCRADAFLCGTVVCRRCTWLAAIVGTLMSEYTYILRGDLFLQFDGKEVVCEKYLLHLVQLSQQNTEKRQLGEKFWDSE